MADKTKFHETVDDLKEIVASTGAAGEWFEEGDSQIFRSRDRATLKWWPKTGTLLVQGPVPAADKLREAVVSHIATYSEDRAPRGAPNVQVFIVHGHDRAALEQTKMILFELNLKPYILQETSGGGKTIIEALEKHLDGKRPKAAFGIVLLTPDDLGASQKDGPSALRPRARQNVVLEMGMLISSIGRSKTLVLVRGDKLERPSDMEGIIYKSFRESVREVAADICDRLREAGFNLKSEDITRACR